MSTPYSSSLSPWRWFFAFAARRSLSSLHKLGQFIGRTLFYLPTKPARIARQNLAACLPDRSEAERELILAAALKHFGCAATESPALWQAPVEQIRAWVQHVEGSAEVDAAIARGQGVILFTPHIGSWEMLGLDASLRWPITHLYKAQKGEVDRLIYAGRSRFGAQLAGSDSKGVRKLLAALKAKQAIGILPDQDPPLGSGLFVAFFGHPAHTPVLPAKLAARDDVACFLCWAERLPQGQGFHIYYQPAPVGIRDTDPQRALLSLNQAIESLVLRLPEQYWWGYPRFRRRPSGAPSFY